MQFDVEYARAQFPQFRDPETAGWAFFENAGGAYAPDQVVDKLDRFFRRTKVQPYYPFQPSIDAGEAMDRSYRRLAQWVGANPEEVHLGPSTTMNVYVLAQALRDQLAPGDEVIVTNQDHEANIGAWRRLADHGARVVEWQVNQDDGQLDLADLERLLNSRTKLVCATHCSNVVGTVNPVQDIVRLAHAAGARVVLDGVSYAPHGLLDLHALDVDFYLFSLYKTYGPHLGLMYVRQDHLEGMANQGHYFNDASLSKRLVPAGPDHGEIACASGIVDYLDDLHNHHFSQSGGNAQERLHRVYDLFSRQERELMAPLLSFLAERPSVRIIGSAEAKPGRAPTIAFSSSRTGNAAIAARLAEAHIGCGLGHFYALRLIESLGINPEEGVMRVSMVHYNTHQEVQRLIEVLQPLV